MRSIVLVICSMVVAIGVYFFVLPPSPTDRLNRSLLEVAGPNGTVSLEACNLSMVIETAGAENSKIALTRAVIEADLRNYDLYSVNIFPNSDGLVGIRIDRGPVNSHMLAQAKTIIEIGGDVTKQFISEGHSAKELLEAKGNVLSFRFMEKVVNTESGLKNSTTHQNASNFFRFAKTIETLPPPTSYRITTSFASDKISAETLLTGEVAVISFLKFSLPSLDQAKELVYALHEYTNANNCQ